MCAGCLPEEDDDDNVIPRAKYQQQASSRKPAAPKVPYAPSHYSKENKWGEEPKQRGEEPKQRKPGWNARPLHEDLYEFWERTDRPDKAPARQGYPAEQQKRASEEARHMGAQRRDTPENMRSPVHSADPRSSRRDPQQGRHTDLASPTIDENSDEALNRLEILLAMGFDESRSRAALERCSSVEAAVEFIMMQGQSGFVTQYLRPAANVLHQAVQPAAPYVAPAAQGLYGVAERVGNSDTAHGFRNVAERVGNSETAGAVHHGGRIAAQGLYGVAEQVGHGLYGVAQAVVGSGSEEGAAGKCPRAELISTLVNLGFSENQAREAAQRNSSVEASVDWITSHPEFK
jgi:hypothetical protein